MLALALGVLLVPAPVTATVGINDYPSNLKSAAQDSRVDPWNFYNRECTSFVAWRLNHDVGIAFHNWYLGKHWGDAAIWKRAAARLRRARGQRRRQRAPSRGGRRAPPARAPATSPG